MDRREFLTRMGLAGTGFFLLGADGWVARAMDGSDGGKRLIVVTTDFRDVIATVLRDHFGLTATQTNRVLPARPKPDRTVNGLIRV